MKTKNFIVIFFLLFLNACNHQKNTNEQHEKASEIKNSEALVLNNGKKWKLDDPTRINIISIKETMDAAAKERQRDYKMLATNLEAELNHLISECKMSGKDHDMLHVWLEEFLSTLKQLKDSNQQEKDKIFEKLNGQMQNFYQYFE
jgi:hypothetical protein